MSRSPLAAVAYNSGRAATKADPVRVIDTLRLFIDLADVLNLEDDFMTCGSTVLRVLSTVSAPVLREGITVDVFLWALEELGPDQWQSFDEGSLTSSMSWCLTLGHEQRGQRLFARCPNVANVRNGANGYTLLHTSDVEESYINTLLSMGADVNSVGFDLGISPVLETPFSLALYRADTFVNLKQALRTVGSSIGDVVDQEMKTNSWPCHLGKEILVELFSEDLDLLAFMCPDRTVCPCCLQVKYVMVQPYWMQILDSLKNRIGPQSVRDVLETMQSTRANSATGEDDERGRESSYLPSHIQTQFNANPDVESE